MKLFILYIQIWESEWKFQHECERSAVYRGVRAWSLQEMWGVFTGSSLVLISCIWERTAVRLQWCYICIPDAVRSQRLSLLSSRGTLRRTSLHCLKANVRSAETQPLRVTLRFGAGFTRKWFSLRNSNFTNNFKEVASNLVN